MSETKLEAVNVDGTVIWVETTDLDIEKSGPVEDRITENTEAGAGKAAEALARVDLASTLEAIIKPAHAALKASAPEEVSLELSLGLKGEVGVFVAKSEANASVKITAKWKFGGSVGSKQG